MWTVVGWPCRTQSIARAPATAYMETTLPHVIPVVKTKWGKKKKKKNQLHRVFWSGMFAIE